MSVTGASLGTQFEARLALDLGENAEFEHLPLLLQLPIPHPIPSPAPMRFTSHS